jgi:hypothetical protein
MIMNRDISIQWHCSQCAVDFGNYVRALVSAFGTGQKLERPFAGISGRVLRGITEEDFSSLTNNPLRQVVFLMGASAMSGIVGLDGKGILAQIGYGADFTNRLLEAGTKFKLVVLPETTLKPATWDNLLDIVMEHYPPWRQKVELARPALKRLSYAEVMAGGGVAAEVRAFLESSLNVNRLFAGDGYTRCEGNAVPLHAEYVSVNKQLTALESFAIISFPVD